jgi:uncharacterized protein (TIGR02145 family)
MAMKRFIIFSVHSAILILLVSGCDTTTDVGYDTSGMDSFSTLELSGEITREMCMSDPGWRALGYRNLGQCVRYAQSGTGSGPSVTDPDGNVYPIVKIGDQWWMAENLRTTRYADGTGIPTGLNNEDWAATESGAYAVFPHGSIPGLDSDEQVLAAYGALYNWFAVDDSRGLCPVGWHVPSDDEWTILTSYLGGEDAAGGKMKSTRTEPDPHPRWENPNEGATNESGFSGLPAGYRFLLGNFSTIGFHTTWWSSTELVSGSVWLRNLNYNFNDIFRTSNPKNNGFSVRCLMD